MNDEVRDDESSALAILIDDPIGPCVRESVHRHFDAITELHLDTQAGLEKMLDDIVWTSTLSRIRSLLSRSLITVACITSYGTTLGMNHRGNVTYGNSDLSVEEKKAVRT